MFTEKQLLKRQAELEASMDRIKKIEVVQDKAVIVLIAITFISVLIFPILNALS